MIVKIITSTQNWTNFIPLDEIRNFSQIDQDHWCFAIVVAECWTQNIFFVENLYIYLKKIVKFLHFPVMHLIFHIDFLCQISFKSFNEIHEASDTHFVWNTEKFNEYNSMLILFECCKQTIFFLCWRFKVDWMKRLWNMLVQNVTQ